MNPYEAPQANSQLPLPVAGIAKPLKSSWHDDFEFVQRNRIAMILNCLIPWVIAVVELGTARPRTGFLAFDFVPGILWLLGNAAWLGCLLGLSWTQGKQFVRALIWVVVVTLNFAGAVSLRYASLLSMTAQEYSKYSGNYGLTLIFGTILGGMVLGGSFVLMLLLRFRSRLVDSRQAEREANGQSPFQWSLGSMIYGTFLVAVVALGISLDQQWGNKEPLVYLFPLFILLFWHELVQRELRWPVLFAVLTFGVVLHVIQFRKYPLSTTNLRNELEVWISFEAMIIAVGLTARWVGWRIVRRSPWKGNLKKILHEHVILTPRVRN